MQSTTCQVFRLLLWKLQARRVGCYWVTGHFTDQIFHECSAFQRSRSAGVPRMLYIIYSLLSFKQVWLSVLFSLFF